MKFQNKHWSLSLLALAACAACALAQVKHPDVNGTWKMNRAKSQFSGGGPEAITIKFELKENTLSEAMTLTNSGGERTIAAKYTTDGKEQDLDIGGDAAKGNAKWEGETLVIAWQADGRLFSRRFAFAADGKTMTATVLQNNGSDIKEDTVVFEKQ